MHINIIIVLKDLMYTKLCIKSIVFQYAHMNGATSILTVNDESYFFLMIKMLRSSKSFERFFLSTILRINGSPKVSQKLKKLPYPNVKVFLSTFLKTHHRALKPL